MTEIIQSYSVMSVSAPSMQEVEKVCKIRFSYLYPNFQIKIVLKMSQKKERKNKTIKRIAGKRIRYNVFLVIASLLILSFSNPK